VFGQRINKRLSVKIPPVSFFTVHPEDRLSHVGLEFCPTFKKLYCTEFQDREELRISGLDAGTTLSVSEPFYQALGATDKIGGWEREKNV